MTSFNLDNIPFLLLLATLIGAIVIGTAWALLLDWAVNNLNKALQENKTKKAVDKKPRI